MASPLTCHAAPPFQLHAAEGDADWAGKHPWKPFDREKDMGAQLAPKNAAALLKATGTLGSRFGTGGK